MPHQFIQRPNRHDLPSMHTSTRTEVDNEICLPHRFIVVLNHQHGIPPLPQLPQRSQQLLIVPRMQPNRRLI
jgi:hypothetical protein